MYDADIVTRVQSHMQRETAPNHPTPGVRFVTLPDSQAVANEAARLVIEQLRQKPDSSLVLPTGKTPLPLYQKLQSTEPALWQKARLFQLDEYIAPKNRADYQDFAQFLDEHLWRHVGGQKFYMRDFNSPEAYEQAIGETDLVILGIGRNGHIAFNEPGSDPGSRIRMIELAPETLRDNFGENANRPGYPTQAVTLGIGTIFASRKIILLATGSGKKEIIEKAFSKTSPPDIGIPASWLKQHPDIIVITDFEASV